jgi:demethylmenaquinone methyltransferase/2-methoxy-6-polyprenyl-1,4-benzoquinol methylase
MAARKPLQAMFEAIPPRYDVINRFFTFGMDKKWRERAISHCLSSGSKKMLDLCCGTGDMALGFVKHTINETEILGLDYSQPMLEMATQKAILGIKGITFVLGDASQMPFKDKSIDCIGISFAFRNLTYKNPLIKSHFREVLRVLNDTGKYVIVESSQPKCRVIRCVFRLYIRHFVYWLGYLLSGNRGAYRYLAESATNFYTAVEIRRMLLSAGFSTVDQYPQFFGAVCIHVATK